MKPGNLSYITHLGEGILQYLDLHVIMQIMFNVIFDAASKLLTILFTPFA